MYIVLDLHVQCMYYNASSISYRQSDTKVKFSLVFFHYLTLNVRCCI